MKPTEEIRNTLLYLKGFSFLSEDNVKVLWETYEKLYGKEYVGNRTCAECQRTELKRMIIDTN